MKLTTIKSLAILLASLLSPIVMAQSDPSEKTQPDEHQRGVTLSNEQMALANINVQPLFAQPFNRTLYAPGEIKANGYTSYVVSPRVDSVVIRRHAILGEHVEQAQPLVTLFSESVADAQAVYRVAYANWQRVKKLSSATISESHILSAQTDYIAAFSRLKAYGLTEKAINHVVENDASPLGEYTLQAERAGSVLNDNFQQGQRIVAGDAIMVLADESELWIEARLAPNKQIKLPAGTSAQLIIDGDTFTAQVIQEAHTIDHQTRTRIVRLIVKNPEHRLHPGMFVDVYFSLSSNESVFAVPESALIRNSDGDWVIYIEHELNAFEPLEVEVGRVFNGDIGSSAQVNTQANKQANSNVNGQWHEITGVTAGSRVVMTGAFFVASQIAKSGFDPHNH